MNDITYNYLIFILLLNLAIFICRLSNVLAVIFGLRTRFKCIPAIVSLMTFLGENLLRFLLWFECWRHDYISKVHMWSIYRPRTSSKCKLTTCNKMLILDHTMLYYVKLIIIRRPWWSSVPLIDLIPI